MNDKTPKYIATVVMFLLFVAIFLFLTFPKESLKKRVTAEIENNTGFSAEIGSVSISPFLELRIKNLNLVKEQKNLNFKIDTLKIKPSLLSLFMSNKTVVPFDAKIGEGRVSGSLVYASRNNSLDSLRAELTNIHTDVITSFRNPDSNSPKFDGYVDGNVNIVFKSGSRLNGIHGDFDFKSEHMSIENLKMEGLKLPAYRDLMVNLHGTISGRKTLIERLSFENSDFDLILAGSMPLVWELRQGGKLDLSLNLNLKSDKAKMGFLQAFMNEQTDGTLSAKIAGTLSKPKFVKGEKL